MSDNVNAIFLDPAASKAQFKALFIRDPQAAIRLVERHFAAAGYSQAPDSRRLFIEAVGVLVAEAATHPAHADQIRILCQTVSERLVHPPACDFDAYYKANRDKMERLCIAIVKAAAPFDIKMMQSYVEAILDGYASRAAEYAKGVTFVEEMAPLAFCASADHLLMKATQAKPIDFTKRGASSKPLEFPVPEGVRQRALALIMTRRKAPEAPEGPQE
jgi:hypothetical protein